jgi:S1-C subfamily serine protease
MLVTVLLSALLCPVWAAVAPTPEESEARLAQEEQVRAEYEAMLEEAARARAEAETARREAARAASKAREAARLNEALARERNRELQGQAEELQRERAMREEEMARVQEELSRAHRELREASREIARAHREVARRDNDHRIVRQINLGDQAVLGVVLGRETGTGVEIIGVSPGGPADRAGLQAGDVLISIRGESLANSGDGAPIPGRETVYRVMSDTEPGEELALVVDRDGESWTFDVTAEQREPSSWQTMIRIPEIPEAMEAAQLAIEGIEIPEIDEEELNRRLQQINEELRTRKFLYLSPDTGEFSIDETLAFPGNFEFEIDELSDLADQALDEADIWFGLPHSQGLELAQINSGLGSYFETDRGVLVIRAREDNAYRLKSGDVVLDINATPVNSPADLMRALREIEPGSEIGRSCRRIGLDSGFSPTPITERNTGTDPATIGGLAWGGAGHLRSGHAQDVRVR